MINRVWLLLMVLLLLMSACAPLEADAPTPVANDPDATAQSPGGEEPPINPYAPAEGDEALTRDEAFIDSQDILILESFPPQYQLHVTGSLPTPCHHLRAVVEEPNEQNQIQVEIYSVVDPNRVCTQVLSPFEVSLPLGSYSSGSYTVILNGEEMGEITP
ncbi:MAG TPA: hypothetical protein VJ785_15760 [Anaerolineales bacterium]|nr:hypothetical protein [Anaerolineales bacterium]